MTDSKITSIRLALGGLSAVTAALVWTSGLLWQHSLDCHHDRERIRAEYLALLSRLANVEAKIQP